MSSFNTSISNFEGVAYIITSLPMGGAQKVYWVC